MTAATLPGTGVPVSTDTLNSSTGLNGGAPVTSEQMQVTKVAYGPATSARYTSGAFPFPVDSDSRRSASYVGRASTFRIPGRAGTTGQKLFSIHNATGSTVLVDLERVTLDMVGTVVKAVTVLPPTIRLYRVTVLPSNGTAVTKVAQDSAQSSSSSLTVLQDASADGTSSASALTATLIAGAVARQVFAPRLITAAGYEVLDTFTFFDSPDQKITLRALEGIVVMLDYTLATQNPVTDFWIVDIKWTEYTLAT